MATDKRWYFHWAIMTGRNGLSMFTLSLPAEVDSSGQFHWPLVRFVWLVTDGPGHSDVTPRTHKPDAIARTDECPVHHKHNTLPLEIFPRVNQRSVRDYQSLFGRTVDVRNRRWHCNCVRVMRNSSFGDGWMGLGPGWYRKWDCRKQ